MQPRLCSERRHERSTDLRYLVVPGPGKSKMDEEPFHKLPDNVQVSLAELRRAIAELEDLLEEFHQSSDLAGAPAEQLDRVIGRMTRWIWPLLDELDREGGYDE
jgi:hypothetical protein